MLQPLVNTYQNLGCKPFAARKDGSTNHGGIPGIEDRLPTYHNVSAILLGIASRLIHPVQLSSVHRQPTLLERCLVVERVFRLCVEPIRSFVQYFQVSGIDSRFLTLTQVLP